MNILILGAGGFIGTNLAIMLAKNNNNNITLVDKKYEYLNNVTGMQLKNISVIESSFDKNMKYHILDNQDVVYHLVSTNVPATSNQHISQDIESNVLFSSKLFDACVKYCVKKVVFISSGGTVYGKEASCPLSEEASTNPISSYGVQKITIEKLLYLYNYMYGLDYRIIRLSNPYGPYQRPNGILGVVTNFIYKALKKEKIEVYGDGNVIRDFIYIDDAVKAIINIANGESEYRLYNLGCGYGTTVNSVLDEIKNTLHIDLNVSYKQGRAVDVPVNYLDIGRYEKVFGSLKPISLSEGIMKTAEYMKRELM